MDDVTADRRADDTAPSDSLVRLLRRYGSVHHRYARAFADWIGLHATDAEALLAISEAEMRDDPLTPARLSAWLSLSSGATATLLKRLERAGYVVRSREHDDRRIVTLRAGSDVIGRAVRFFTPLGARLDALVDTYSAADLARFERFLDEVTEAMSDHLARQLVDAAPHRIDDGGEDTADDRRR